MTIPAYPLHWPPNFQRTTLRERGAFKTDIRGAMANVDRSLRLFASDSRKRLDNLVISSNVTLGSSNPRDPGVSVWFTWDNLDVCIAVDRYLSVESNLQAIHHIIEARRVELRHGTLALVRASFAGFKALPQPTTQWWQVLRVPERATIDDIKEAYRSLAKEHHPDRGGNGVTMAQINTAYDQAVKLRQ